MSDTYSIPIAITDAHGNAYRYTLTLPYTNPVPEPYPYFDPHAKPDPNALRELLGQRTRPDHRPGR